MPQTRRDSLQTSHYQKQFPFIGSTVLVVLFPRKSYTFCKYMVFRQWRIESHQCLPKAFLSAQSGPWTIPYNLFLEPSFLLPPPPSNFRKVSFFRLTFSSALPLSLLAVWASEKEKSFFLRERAVLWDQLPHPARAGRGLETFFPRSAAVFVYVPIRFLLSRQGKKHSCYQFSEAI